MTQLLITMIDWEYPVDDEPISPIIWDLYNKETLMQLYMALANGIVVEMKAEGDIEEAIDILRGMLRGAGSAKAITLSDTVKENLWLFEEGFECYQQGSDKHPGYVFINPVPQPDKFG
jgi:hypothetical protein